MWVFEPACADKVWIHVPGEVSRLAGIDDLGDIPGLSTGSAPLAYVLLHGGPLFTRPATRLDEASLAALHEVEAYLPAFNGATYTLARQGYDKFPKRAQYILCETAYFLKMPASAVAYGLPYEMFDAGIRRYGGQGLQHEWTWRIARKDKDVRRVISVGLGDAPSLCAILDGEPIETSAGFSLCEGIPSMRTCGTLDPSIPILLQQSGYSPAEIEDLLTCASGWQALTRTPYASLINILEAESGGLVWQMLHAHVLKELGTCMAALGGAQALFFTGEEILRWLPIVIETCAHLSFCGIQTGELRPAGDGIWRLEKSTSSSMIEMRELRRSDMLGGWIENSGRFKNL